MEKQFKRYGDIENTYRKKHMDTIVTQGKSGGEWCVTEKVHGANASFWTYNGEDFFPAKRTEFVDKEENFFNIHDVLKDNIEGLKGACRLLKKYFGTVDEIVFFGELFGGSYDHPDVKKNPKAAKVQKGVMYSPDNLFYMFDIRVNGVHISQSFVEEIGREYYIFYAMSLMRGTLEECLQYPNDGVSTIPVRLILPEIEDNIMEGVVIKPVEPTWFNSGSRVILKNKNEKFSEKAHKSDRKPKVEVVLSEQLQKLLDEAQLYVTENRLRNVISKVGKVTNKDFGKLMGMFTKDAIEEFMKDFPDVMGTLEKSERKMLNKRLSNISAELIRTNFLNIIDGEF